MKKLLMWALVHAFHWAVLYGAFALRLDGAMHVLKFAVWLLMPLAVLAAFSDEAAKKTAQPPLQPVLSTLTRVQSWATLGCLVWFGHFATALAWAASMFLIAAQRERARKLRTDGVGEVKRG